jgi:hypothetical protein
MTAELGGGLCHAIEPRCQPDVELCGARERLPGYEGGSQARFGKLFLGVVEEARRRQPRKWCQHLLGSPEALVGLVDASLGITGPEPVDGANGEATRTDGLPTRCQRRLAGLV